MEEEKIILINKIRKKKFYIFNYVSNLIILLITYLVFPLVTNPTFKLSQLKFIDIIVILVIIFISDLIGTVIYSKYQWKKDNNDI